MRRFTELSDMLQASDISGYTEAQSCRVRSTGRSSIDGAGSSSTAKADHVVLVGQVGSWC
jgi:hypothetical protein